MRRLRQSAALLALCTAMLCRPAPLRATVAPVENPKVTTSGSVDCSSIPSILRGVLRPGMSDEERLLALYNWFRRTVYHYRMMGADRRDTLRAINSYGCALCGSQAALFRELCHAADFKARIASGNGGEELGHTAIEVWYGGRWHLIDTMTAFWVRRRGPNADIASMADLAADPTLVSTAQPEGRCGPEFLYCIRHPESDYALRQRMMAAGMIEDIAWTLLVIAPGPHGEHQDVRTFWMEGPKHPELRDPEDAYGARYQPGLLDITLKPHEQYVRLWDNVGRWMVNGNFDPVGPYHTCGPADELDPVDFRYYEPYRKDRVGYARYAYRYYANGWLDWQPQNGEIRLGAKPANLTLDSRTGVLSVADEREPASLTIPVKSPYAVVDISLALDIRSADPHTSIAVSWTPDADEYNHGIAPQSKTLRMAQGIELADFDVGRRKDLAGGVFGYHLQIDVRGGKASFAVKRLKTTFMLNMFSLPYLAPGDNIVRVAAAQGSSGMRVEYQWAEGPGWKRERTDTHIVRGFPATYRIDVAGPKMPRMKRLVLEAVPEPVTTARK